MSIRNFVIMCSVVLLIPLSAFSQDDKDVERRDVAGRGKVGTTGMQFLKIGVSARAVGMAEAFVALANDASAVYYNPAGLAVDPKKSVMLTHIEWPADINYEFGAAILPVSQADVFGFFIGVLSTGDMKVTVPYQGWTGGYFSASDWVAGVTYGRKLTDRFSFGGTAKFITEYLGEDSAQNFAVDIGTLFDVGVRGLKFGMNITNFGVDAKYERDQFSLPINFRLGAILDVFRNDFNSLVASFEGSHPNDNVEQIAFGVEYSIKQAFALRAGYRTNLELEELDKVDEPLEGLSVGAGAAFSISEVNAQLDYAYSDLGFLNTAHRFTVSFEF